MDDKDFFYAMKVRGYTIFEKALKPKTVHRIHETLCAIPEDQIYNGVIRNLFDKFPAECLIDVMENEVVLPRIDALLGDTFIYYSFNSSPLYPGAKSSAGDFHRDTGRYIPGYDYAFNILYAISDFTKSTGVTQVLPGSHLFEEKPSDTYLAENAVDIELPAGSALIFNSNLWHAAGWNYGHDTRWGMGLTCKRSFMRQQFDLPRALNPELVNQLSERCRQLLGFYVRVPTCMEEYLLPEEERLYRAGQG